MSSLGGSDSDCLIKDKSGAELHIGLKRMPGGAWELQTTNPAFSGDGHAEVEIVADISILNTNLSNEHSLLILPVIGSHRFRIGRSSRSLRLRPRRDGHNQDHRVQL